VAAIQHTLKRLAWLALAGSLLFAALAWAALSAGNRDVAPPTMAERQQAYVRALGWFHAHEAEVLADGNPALWGMLQTTADLTNEAYLRELVARNVANQYRDPQNASAWKRMIYPKAEVVVGDSMTALVPYQRFFYHALTCIPVPLAGGDTTRFLTENVCRPQWLEVWRRDMVCSTHQLMGIELARRVGCALPPGLPALEAELLGDIKQQMQWDALMKDAYIQRVLMLYWLGQGDQVKPIWLKRVLSAQHADGGWAGGKQVPEWPHWMQPEVIKFALLGLVGQAPPQGALKPDFHATAQGMLIATLSLRQTPQAASAP
jgi:hypothetical protein